MKFRLRLYSRHKLARQILWVVLLLNLHVVSEGKDKSLKAIENNKTLMSMMYGIEPISLISSHDTPVQSSMQSSNRSREPYLVVSETVREVTAYNAGDPSQTDDDPCISANGENICAVLKAGHKRCAANFVPFGTMLKIDKYGVCMVTDRMNKRYKNRVDVAMLKHEKNKALRFGLQKLNVQILERNT